MSWLKIMHYELSDNSYDNRVTNMDFFFNSDEKKDPIKEFEAQKSSSQNQHSIQKIWKQYVDSDASNVFQQTTEKKIPTDKCKKFIKWKQLLDFKTIKFIYASSFPNNPASMFGHTLITLSKDEEKPSLESLSISYMAQPAEGFCSSLFHERINRWLSREISDYSFL